MGIYLVHPGYATPPEDDEGDGQPLEPALQTNITQAEMASHGTTESELQANQATQDDLYSASPRLAPSQDTEPRGQTESAIDPALFDLNDGHHDEVGSRQSIHNLLNPENLDPWIGPSSGRGLTMSPGPDSTAMEVNARESLFMQDALAAEDEDVLMLRQATDSSFGDWIGAQPDDAGEDSRRANDDGN